MADTENRSLIPFGKDRASEQADRGSAESPRTTSPHQLGDSSDARTASLLAVRPRRKRKTKRQVEIERTLRHALATRSTETDSWLNAYQADVSWLIAELEAVQ